MVFSTVIVCFRIGGELFWVIKISKVDRSEISDQGCGATEDAGFCSKRSISKCERLRGGLRKQNVRGSGGWQLRGRREAKDPGFRYRAARMWISA